jgi:hypothetical protein
MSRGDCKLGLAEILLFIAALTSELQAELRRLLGLLLWRRADGRYVRLCRTRFRSSVKVLSKVCIWQLDLVNGTSVFE